MVTIRRIDPKNYPMGKQVSYHYTSEKYYKVQMDSNSNGWNISLTEAVFEMPFEKNIEEEIEVQSWTLLLCMVRLVTWI